jgi:hypothetical protein
VLHSRVNDSAATAVAFDLLMHNGDDLRRKPFSERKAMLRKVLQRTLSTSSIPKAMAGKCSRRSASSGLRADWGPIPEAESDCALRRGYSLPNLLF